MLTLSANNIVMHCLTHPFTDSFCSIFSMLMHPFIIWHPLLFVMFLINFVDLMNLSFFICFSHQSRCSLLFTVHATADISILYCLAPFVLLCRSESIFLLIFPYLLATHCSGGLSSLLAFFTASASGGPWLWRVRCLDD